MNTVIDQCQRTWRRLGVEAEEIASMSEELDADMHAASEDGVTAEAFVGGDPAGFARAWASARGAIRPRWRIVQTAIAAGVGVLPAAAMALLLPLAMTSPWFIRIVDPNNSTLFCISPSCGDPRLNLSNWMIGGWYLICLSVAIAGALGTVSAWLRRCADPARRLTVQVMLIVGPIGALAAGAVARMYDNTSTPPNAWPILFAPLLLGVLAACRWFAVRRSRSEHTTGLMHTEDHPSLIEASYDQM